MRKKVLFSFVIFFIVLNSVVADTRTVVDNQNIHADSSNPLREYAKKTVSNNDSALKTTKTKDELDLPSDSKLDNAPSAGDYGTNLSSLVDTSDDSYEKLLAHAEEILGDDVHSETRKKIDLLTSDLEEKIAKENQSKQHESMKKTSEKANQIIKDEHDIKNDFKKPHDYYQGKSAKDYIDQDVKNYNDAYEIENYHDLLENIKDPEQIEKTFDEIDDDDNKYQYKLKDGYPIEQITTVGLLEGQEKRLKKCLIMKTYGGGTWRTYCQPLKKPTQCPSYDWDQLDTMAIMYC
ncbi:hypothetical protein LO80_04280 [Candidatus Francisella endociliophora]|uniref:Uncharacterized protein n=1 Tax=Candidatus Francisella endociliophora TaxID=653937 RepID=A0A097ENW8_9GAMM|nr:hypothetical protein [Francisella sp. FSC1006]AIT09261.1 hypothetical protein LO80_04280 [Francisella sp. FSC1006]